MNNSFINNNRNISNTIIRSNRNNSLEIEINELKEKLIKANITIEQQNKEIQELKTQLNSFKDKHISEINILIKEINDKDKKLNQLNQQLKNINYSSNNNDEKNKLENDKVVNFISTEQNLFFAIACNGNSTFAEVEEKLYKEYPEFRETNNTFLANGSVILRFKTINENKIGDGRPILLDRPFKNENNVNSTNQNKKCIYFKNGTKEVYYEYDNDYKNLGEAFNELCQKYNWNPSEVDNLCLWNYETQMIPLDNNKSLLENGIQDGDKILVVKK